MLESTYLQGYKKFGFEKTVLRHGDEKQVFCEMVNDFIADRAPDLDGMEIDEPERDESRGWVVTGHIEECLYELSAVDGNIYLNYLGKR